MGPALLAAISPDDAAIARAAYAINVVADAKAALRALIPHLRRKEDRTWRETIEANVARWWETMQMEAMVSADPINPLRLFSELSPQLPDDAIVTADSGSAANWYARNLRFRGNIRGSLSGTLATMGPAVPYGIGAKFAPPTTAGRRVRRRRCDADERHGRADHHQTVLAGVGRSTTDCGDSAQQRSQPGHLGDACDGRCTEIR
jgi:thiamine pyrophosphate-dependent acetolactate synthase large subunit-like protein